MIPLHYFTASPTQAAIDALPTRQQRRWARVHPESVRREGIAVQICSSTQYPETLRVTTTIAAGTP